MTQRKLRCETLECRLALAVVGPDLTFGSAGESKHGFVENSSSGATAYEVAIQPDGKIVGAGDGTVVRMLSDGQLDQAFGDAGLVGLSFQAVALALQSDGKIVVAGNHTGTEIMVARFQSSGELDATFGNDGIVSLDLGDKREGALAVEIDPAGRIVLAGEVSGPLVVVRLTSSGALDSSFADGGIFLHDMGASAFGDDLVFQPNGSILVAGSDRIEQELFVARINSNGIIDTSFGDQGVTNIDFGDGFFDEYGPAVALQADGRIVASCSYDLYWLSMVRLNSDGTFDTSFSDDGRVQLEVPLSLDSDVVVQPDGRILAMARGIVLRLLPSGQEDSTFSRLNNSFSGIFQGIVLAADGSFIVAGTESGLVFKKGLPSGLPDLTFGENGTMRIVPGPSSDTSSGSALQADGKLVMAGMTNGNLGVMRYAADGAFDATFGNEGRSTLPAPVGYILYSVADVVVSNNGFITVAGTFRKSDVAQYDLFLARLKSDGTLDTAFGQQGFVITDLGAEEHAVDMLLQADGKLVLAANQYQAGWRANLVRYNFNGSLDTSFAQNGVSRMATGGAYLNRILLQPDNRILAGGFLNFGSGISRSLLTRFKANGAVDGSFGVNGKVVEVRGPIDTVTDIALATDGTIYVTGGNLMVQRYSRDGVRDTSFSWSPYQLQVPFDFRTETRSGINPQLILQSDGLILSGNFGDRSLVVAFRMNGALDERFSGDGKWIATTATRGDVKLNKLLLQRDGRLLATGTYTDTHADFVAYRFAASNRPTVTTTVAMNANGQLEISDRWSHDDQWRFGRTDKSLIVTDLSTDRRVKFTVVGLPEITGNETKQIVIPLSLLDQTRQSLIINSLGGDDKFTFSNQFNAPTFGMSIRAGAGSDTFDLSNQAVPINWLLYNATSGSARPLTRTPMTFAGVEKLVGGTNTDTFRLTYQGSADRLVIDGGGGNLDAIQLTADQDMSFATIQWPNDSLHLTVGRNQPQLYAMQNIEKATFTAGASDNWLDFSGFPGTLTVFAGAGNDTIFSGSDRSVIYGQAGNDTVFGSAQSDRLIGGDGDDVLIGSSGDDQLYGDAGKDILVGSAGADRLLGGDGNDILIGGFCSAIEALPKSRVRTLVTDTWTTAPSYALGYHYLAVLGVGRNLLKLTVGSTVLSDNEVDTYFGQADLDWFLLDAAKELNASQFGLQDQQVGERVSI